MPKLRDASAPKVRPIDRVITIASTSARVGSHPSMSPLDSPPGPPCVTMFPSM